MKSITIKPQSEKEITKAIRYAPQIKTLRAIHERRRKKTPIVKCAFCGKEFKRSRCEVLERNYCSRKCANKNKGKYISEKLKGKKVSECTKEKLRMYTGEKTSNWKGGRPKCKECGKEINYRSQYCQKHKQVLWTKEKWEKIWNGTRIKRAGKMPKNISRPGKFGNVKRGWYKINGKRMFFRSLWEVNYALYLDFLKKEKLIEMWEYEPDSFIFEKIKSGTRSYRPDFKITKKDQSIEYHEVKGWMTPKSKTQIKRMAKYYPNIKLRIIGRKEYDSIYKKMNKMLEFY